MLSKNINKHLTKKSQNGGFVVKSWLGLDFFFARTALMHLVFSKTSYKLDWSKES